MITILTITTIIIIVRSALAGLLSLELIFKEFFNLIFLKSLPELSILTII